MSKLEKYIWLLCASPRFVCKNKLQDGSYCYVVLKLNIFMRWVTDMNTQHWYPSPAIFTTKNKAMLHANECVSDKGLVMYLPCSTREVKETFNKMIYIYNLFYNRLED